MRYLRSLSKPALLTLQLALIGFLTQLALETSSVFLPLYAAELGASNMDVGLIAASSGMAFLVSSLVFGRLSDINGRLGFIRFGIGLSTVVYLLQLIAPTPMTLLGVWAFLGFCLGGSLVALTAYVYEVGEDVGKFSSYSPLGSLIGLLAAAAIRDYHALFITSAVGSAIAFVISLMLRKREQNRTAHMKVPLFPTSVIWTNRKIYLPYLLRHTGASAIWAIFPLYLASIGASKTWIAIINGINVGGQFIAMRFIERFNVAKAFRVGLFISIAVFAIYGIATYYLQLIPVQIFLAIAWSCMYVGALSFLLKKNVERGTAVGVLFSTTRLSSAIGPLLGGGVSQIWGFRPLMFVASALSFTGLIFSRGVEGKKQKS
jgi:MFS family permease